MLNPMMETVKELRKMNDKLTDQLDQIIQRLDALIEQGEPKPITVHFQDNQNV